MLEFLRQVLGIENLIDQLTIIKLDTKQIMAKLGELVGKFDELMAELDAYHQTALDELEEVKNAVMGQIPDDVFTKLDEAIAKVRAATVAIESYQEEPIESDEEG